MKLLCKLGFHNTQKMDECTIEINSVILKKIIVFACIECSRVNNVQYNCTLNNEKPKMIPFTVINGNAEDKA